MNPASALALYEAENPFVSEASLRTSNYSAYVRGRVLRLLDFRRPSPISRMAHGALRRFVTSTRYPCVGAKSVFHRATYRFGYYGSMTDTDGAAGLARDLCAFVYERRGFEQRFSSFVALFADAGKDEARFEADLWHVLYRLRRLDESVFPYAAGVSRDPADPRYAFSFACEAMFVVGLHPRASRMARRFTYPALVFNSHRQFAQLRAEGRWERFRRIVRAADVALQGTANPNLSDFGQASEARQYSGRPAPPQWSCPLHRP